MTWLGVGERMLLPAGVDVVPRITSGGCGMRGWATWGGSRSETARGTEDSRSGCGGTSLCTLYGNIQGTKSRSRDAFCPTRAVGDLAGARRSPASGIPSVQTGGKRRQPDTKRERCKRRIVIGQDPRPTTPPDARSILPAARTTELPVLGSTASPFELPSPPCVTVPERKGRTAFSLPHPPRTLASRLSPRDRRTVCFTTAET